MKVLLGVLLGVALVVPATAAAGQEAATGVVIAVVDARSSPPTVVGSGGGTVAASELAPGRYEVRFPGLGGPVHALTTAWVSGAYVNGIPSCRIGGFNPSSPASVVVNCSDPSGRPLRPSFTVGLRLGSATAGYGFVLADRPTAASYTPDLRRQDVPGVAAVTVRRSGVGRYTVRLPGLGSAPGAPMVTALSDQPVRCVVSSTARTAGDAVIGVQCSAGAAAADSQFVLQLGVANDLTGTGARGGWAIADRPTTGTYLATARSVGGSGSVRVTRYYAGHYRVRFNGLTSATHQFGAVVALDGQSECVTGSGGAGFGMTFVFCFGPDGQLRDAPFAAHLSTLA